MMSTLTVSRISKKLFQELWKYSSWYSLFGIFKVSLYSEKIYISEGSFILLSDIFQACFVSLTFVFRCLNFFYRCLYSACLRTRVKRLLWASRWVFIIYIGISLLDVHADWINWIEILQIMSSRWSLLSLCSCLLNELNWNLETKIYWNFTKYISGDSRLLCVHAGHCGEDAGDQRVHPFDWSAITITITITITH